MENKKYFYTMISLMAIMFIDSLGFGLSAPILSPLFFDPVNGIFTVISIGLRDVDYSTLLVIFALVMFLFAPILGEVSDQIGRKKVLLFSLFGTGMGSFICALAIGYKSYILLLVGRIISGVCASSQATAQAAILDISKDGDKVKNIGLIAAASSAGFVFGPIIGGIFSDKNLISWFTYKTPFYLDVILAILNGILLFYCFKESSNKIIKIRTFSFMKSLHVFTEGFKRKSIRDLSILLLLSETTFAFYIQFSCLYLVSEYHFSSSRLGVFMSLTGVILTLTLSILVRIIIKFFAVNKMIKLGLFLSLFGLLFLSIDQSELMQWIAVFPIVSGIALGYNGLLANFSDVAAIDEQGWVMGVTGSVVAMAWVMGALLTGLFYYFSQYFAFLFMLLIIFVCLIKSYLLKNPQALLKNESRTHVGFK